jgi:MFS family permease
MRRPSLSRSAGQLQASFQYNPVFSAAGSVWALLLGMAFLMLGNGLQGTLLGVRAASEGFGSTVTGFVMTGYFVGFLLGSLVALKTIKRVGHLRVFAAATCLASLAILLQSLFVTPLIWAVMRILTGYCLASAYIVTESWLNDRVTNQHRGGLLAVYMIISYSSIAGGQLLLNGGSPDNHDLFIVCSVLITFAAIPILLSITPQPVQETTENFSLKELYRVSPLGVVGAFAGGVLQGALFSMGAVYARAIGLSIADTSIFMFLIIGGAAIFQWPVGKLSDMIDRRRVIAGLALTGAIMPVVTYLVISIDPGLILWMAAILGVAPFLLYSLFIAYTNDYLRPEQMVAASSRLTLIFGSGAVIGPPLVGVLMDLTGPQGFLGVLAFGHAGLFAFALYRMTRRESVPLEEQSPYYPGAATRTASLAPAYAEWVQEKSEENEAPSENKGSAETPEPENAPDPDPVEDPHAIVKPAS